MLSEMLILATLSKWVCYCQATGRSIEFQGKNKKSEVFRTYNF